jgi:hypothetical protein
MFVIRGGNNAYFRLLMNGVDYWTMLLSKAYMFPSRAFAENFAKTQLTHMTNLVVESVE